MLSCTTTSFTFLFLISSSACEVVSLVSSFWNWKTDNINGRKIIIKKNAIITFVAFVLFGFIPLFSFVLAFFGLFNGNSFELSIILTFFSLFILGSLKSKITNKSWIKSGIETLIIGGIASGIAYYVGYLVSGFV